MEGRAPQSRYCSDACRQSAYRLRKSSSANETEQAPSQGMDAPTVVLHAPAIASLEHINDQWKVIFVDGQVVEVSEVFSKGQARSHARFAVARAIEEESLPSSFL